jgi:hypothetical protein
VVFCFTSTGDVGFMSMVSPSDDARMYTVILETEDLQEAREFPALGPAMHFAAGRLKRLAVAKARVRIETSDRQVVFPHEQIAGAVQALSSYSEN